MSRTFTGGEFVRYAAVGASGVVVDLSVLAVLHEVVGVPVLAANVVSFSVAVCSNFLLNRHWTFRSHRQRHVAVGGGLFLLGALVGLALNEAGLWALQSAHVHWVLAKLAMTAVVLCWNYAFNASVTFRKTEHHSQAGLEAAKVEHP